MSSELSARRYAAIVLLVGTLATPSFALAVNAVVDPYGIWNWISIENFNAFKPARANRDRLFKPYDIRFRRPKHIVLGTSRAAWGLNTDHAALDSTGYNLGLPGSSLREMEAYLNHALDVTDLQIVVMGLDFFAFNAHRVAEDDVSDRAWLSSHDASFGWRRHQVRVSTSTSTFWDSVRTVRGQDPAATWPVVAAGGYIDTTGLHDRVISRDGYRKGFRRSLIGWARNQYFPVPRRAFAFSPDIDNENLDAFESILNTCERANVDLLLFVSPIHATHIDLIDALGLWDEFESWKRELVRINDAQPEPAPLWDFSGFSEYTMESIPRRDDFETEMRYHVDSSHYGHALGNMVLDVLLSDAAPDPALGEQLTSEVIEDSIVKTRAQREAYQQSRADDHAWVSGIATRSKPSPVSDPAIAQ